MKTGNNANKKKLKKSLVTLIVGLIFLGISIFGVVTYFLALSQKDIKTINYILVGVSFVCIIIAIVLFFVSVFANIAYRKTTSNPGKLSNFLYVLEYIWLAPTYFVLKFLSFFGYSQPEETRQTKIVDEFGDETTLTPTWETGMVVKKQFYEDESGKEWVSEDGGETVSTVIKKVKDEDGEEYTLTPRFTGSTEYYRDQNGDDWRTWDGGKTYKKE